MPSEYRKLIFTDDEVMDALEVHDDAASGRLEGQNIVKLAHDPDVDGALIATLDDEDASAVELPDFYVTAALMRFLIEEGIPMPRRATKSVSIEKTRVVLNVVVDHEEAEKAAAA